MRPETLLDLFDRVGAFLVELEELQKRWHDLTPEQRLAAVDAIFMPAARAKINQAISDYQSILDTIYDASDRGCTMKVKMR